MQPVLILKNDSKDDPSYLGTWLRQRGVSYVLIDGQAGEALPRDIRAYSALALLGGPMSANDELSWLVEGMGLIRQAVELDVPVIGHCLGGQLMARALGARVTRSPQPEIGWQPVTILDAPQAMAWFGPARQAHVMQWHYDAFELPAGAVSLATSPACPYQAFAIGPHLGLQFHLEIDEAKALAWSQEQSRQWAQAQARYPSVQDAQSLRASTLEHLPAHQALADRVYGHWLRGVGAP